MYISIDIGGTNTRVALSKNCKDIKGIEIFSTAKGLKDQREQMSQVIKRLVGSDKIEAVAIGAAGTINRPEQTILNFPHFREEGSFKFADFLEDKGVKLFCANDAEMAGLGEAVLGAGKGYKRVAYLGVGTGVGGTLIVDHKLPTQDNNFEPGWQIIDFRSTDDALFYLPGSLQEFASGTAFHKKYKQKSHECTDPKIWSEYGSNLGVGISNLLFFWRPDLLVIGGGLSDSFDKFIPSVSKKLEDFGTLITPNIVKAHFGQKSGIMGGFVKIGQELS